MDGPPFSWYDVESMTKQERILAALLSAEAHVYRQQGHGRHEQDQIDAKAWIDEYGDFMRGLRGYDHVPKGSKGLIHVPKGAKK